MRAPLVCQTSSDLFFSTKPKEVKEAKGRCAGCPLMEECRERGWDEEHGVWGGLSALDRKKTDRQRYDRAVAAAGHFSDQLDAHLIQRRIERWGEDEAARNEDRASREEAWERGPSDREAGLYR